MSREHRDGLHPLGDLVCSEEILRGFVVQIAVLQICGVCDVCGVLYDVSVVIIIIYDNNHNDDNSMSDSSNTQ